MEYVDDDTENANTVTTLFALLVCRANYKN